MATIRLGRYEARQGNLPAVCMRCGTAASVYRKRIFYDSPWWVYLGILFGLFPVFMLAWYWINTAPVVPLFLSLSIGIPFFIVAWYRSRSAPVRVPLCPLHRNLWRWRQPGLVLACSIVSVGFLIPLDFAPQGKHPPKEEELIILLAGLAVLTGPYMYLGTVIALKYLGIHATKIDATSITLTGVAVEFAEAVRVEHQLARSEKENMSAEAPQVMRTQS
jgi:hypothetical protein